MKKILLYLELIGIRVLQGLQKIGILILGVVGIVNIWNIATNYFKAKQIPNVKEIFVLLICIVGIIVLMTIKNIINTKCEDINDKINHMRSLQKHKDELRQRNEHRLAEKSIEQETFDNEPELLDIKRFKVDKIKKGDVSELDNLVGLESVKQQLKKMKATMEYEKAHGGIKKRATFHMKFTGNPGTGKTTVAKAVASILYDAHIIQKPKYIAVNGNDLMGAYLGHTAPTINALFKQAEGGLIFVDEAYAIANSAGSFNGSGYGHEAVSQLLTHLENRDNKTVVIFGGYAEPMEKFFDMNPGLRSRVPLTLEFPDYTPNELLEILEINLYANGHKLSEEAKPVLLHLFSEKIIHCKVNNFPFSNGRYARNIADELHAQHALNYADDKSIGSIVSTKDINFNTLLNLD